MAQLGPPLTTEQQLKYIGMAQEMLKQLAFAIEAGNARLTLFAPVTQRYDDARQQSFTMEWETGG